MLDSLGMYNIQVKCGIVLVIENGQFPHLAKESSGPNH